MWSEGKEAPFKLLADLRPFPAASSLLAVSELRSPDAGEHDIVAALIAMSLAAASAAGSADYVSGIAEAELLYDAGLSNIAPERQRSDQSLTVEEWMSFASHPEIGTALVKEITGFRLATQRVIPEHHETLDGFGYPRTLRGTALSKEGRILALAQAIGTLAVENNVPRHIRIALNIVPGEFDPVLNQSPAICWTC